MNNAHSKPEERWIKFQIGSAFPAKSILSQWIAGLTMAANDLLQTNKTLLEKADLSGKEPSSEALFYFWLACAQYRETAKFLFCYKGSQSVEIQEFIESLPVETRSQWDKLRSSCQPWDGSFVESITKPIRDRFFHYPEPTSPEWESVLGGLASEESGIRVKNEMRVSNVRGIFADDLRSYFLSTYLGASKDKVADSMKQIAYLTSTLVNFTQQALTSYIQNLPKEVIRFDDSSAC